VSAADYLRAKRKRLTDSSYRDYESCPKAVAHTSIQTTGDIYADWDIDQLAATMADVLASDDELL
jgi:hypothetical protein